MTKLMNILLCVVRGFSYIQGKMNIYGKPITVWENDLFETGVYNLLPVQFILSRTVSLIDNVEELGNALLVVPCIEF